MLLLSPHFTDERARYKVVKSFSHYSSPGKFGRKLGFELKGFKSRIPASQIYSNDKYAFYSKLPEQESWNIMGFANALAVALKHHDDGRFGQKGFCF